MWESLNLKADSKKRKFAIGYSKHLPEKKPVNMYIWVAWIPLGLLRSILFLYIIGMKKKNFFLPTLKIVHASTVDYRSGMPHQKRLSVEHCDYHICFQGND